MRDKIYYVVKEGISFKHVDGTRQDGLCVYRMRAGECVGRSRNGENLWPLSLLWIRIFPTTNRRRMSTIRTTRRPLLRLFVLWKDYSQISIRILFVYVSKIWFLRLQYTVTRVSRLSLETRIPALPGTVSKVFFRSMPMLTPKFRIVTRLVS